jgi:hypothetical protein
MTKFYSRTTNGFYSSEINGNNMPSDAVEVTQQEYEALFTGQDEGKQIVPDSNGRPMLVEPPPPTYDRLRAAEYPPIMDYLDGVVKGDQAQIDTYIAACLAVKAKYPKE